MDPIPPPKEYDVPKDFHLNNRNKFLKLFRQNVKELEQTLLLFRGAESIPKHDDDQEYRVDQEANLFYLFGAMELNCYCALAPDTGKTFLFAYKYPESYKMWMVVKSNEELKKEYQIDEVLFVDELEGFLHNYSPKRIFYYQGVDSDSGISLKVPEFPFLKKYDSDYSELYWILNESRVTKSPQEVDIMRYICMLSSEAHELVLKRVRNGNKEYQMEALFKYHQFVNCGCRFAAYECICASGEGAATLHYIENDKVIQDNQLILSDMGGKYHGYCSDITVTFPSNAKFNEKQKVIYNAVLDAQRQVHSQLKVGVNWGDMHMLAERVITQHLLSAGLLRGSFEELMEKRIGSLFFTHGLGHLLGLRTHDVGGYNKGCPPKLPELSKLRFRRNLEAGMVFTNEPGCYFIDFILQKAFNDEVQKQYLVKDKILDFMEVGGVRLEDDIVLHENGPEILNKVPRSVEQVEACMRGEDWTKVD